MSTQTPAALTVPLAQAARLLGMSESNARLLERQGKFPVKVQRVGSWLRVSRAEIDAYLHVAPPPPAPLDRDAIWLEAEIAAQEARLAALYRARPATTTTQGEAGPGLPSRTAGPSRIADRDATYPAVVPVGTLGHTGPATVAGARGVAAK